MLVARGNVAPYRRNVLDLRFGVGGSEFRFQVVLLVVPTYSRLWELFYFGAVGYFFDCRKRDPLPLLRKYGRGQ